MHYTKYTCIPGEEILVFFLYSKAFGFSKILLPMWPVLMIIPVQEFRKTVKLDKYVWQMETAQQDVLNFAILVYGALCVMTFGISKTLELSADNLDCLQSVSKSYRICAVGQTSEYDVLLLFCKCI